MIIAPSHARRNFHSCSSLASWWISVHNHVILACGDKLSLFLSRAMCAPSAIHPTPASQHKASPLFSIAAATAAIATVLMYSCSARCYHAKIQLTEIRLANKRPVQMWARGVESQHLDPCGVSRDWIYLSSTAWLALMWRKCCIFIFHLRREESQCQWVPFFIKYRCIKADIVIVLCWIWEFFIPKCFRDILRENLRCWSSPPARAVISGFHAHPKAAGVIF